MIAAVMGWSGGLRRTRADTLVLVVLISVVAVTAERIWLGHGLPLWLDETWTAMIVSQPTWTSFWREAWLDCNPPLYYLFQKIWSGFFGISNLALRMPSAILFYAAAAVPLLVTSHGLGRRAALTWSALMLLWWPGFFITLDARGYSLLFLLSTCNLVVFLRLHQRMDTRLLLSWCALGSAQILTHYFAAFLVAAQGAFLLWRFREHMVKRWYCALAFAPALGWTYIHLPRLAEYARDDVVWYQATTLTSVPLYAMYMLGAPNVMLPLILLLALVGAWWKSGRSIGSTSPAEPEAVASRSAARAAILACFLAWVAILTASAFQASLTPRYLVPLVPTTLLAVVLLARNVAREDIAYPLILLVYLAYALVPGPLAEKLDARSRYGYERPSEFIAQSQPTHLVFLWDHPATKILAPESLQQIGGLFLKRAGTPVQTTAIVLADGSDPNPALLAAVKNDRTALLWLYNAEGPSGASRFPPTISRLGQWQCQDDRNYVTRPGRKRILEVGVLACVPATSGKSS